MSVKHKPTKYVAARRVSGRSLHQVLGTSTNPPIDMLALSGLYKLLGLSPNETPGSTPGTPTEMVAMLDKIRAISDHEYTQYRALLTKLYDEEHGVPKDLFLTNPPNTRSTTSPLNETLGGGQLLNPATYVPHGTGNTRTKIVDSADHRPPEGLFRG